MDISANSKSKCSKRNGEGDVQGGRARRVLQPKALARNVSAVSNGAHYPRRQAPRLYVIGGYREDDTDEGVPDTEKNGRTYPWLTR